MQFAVSRRLRDEYANGRAYYELDGRTLQPPKSAAASRLRAALLA